MKNCNSMYPVFFLRIPKSRIWWMISPRGFCQLKKRGTDFTAYLTEKDNLMALLTPPQKEDLIRRYNELPLSDQGRMRVLFALAWHATLNKIPIIRIPENLVRYFQFDPMADLVLDHVHHMTYIAKKGTVKKDEEISTVLANCADQIMKVTWYKRCCDGEKSTMGKIKAFRFLDVRSSEEDHFKLEQIDPDAFASSDVSVAGLPNGLQKIGRGAFRNSRDLIEVILPDSLLEIDDDAFENCVNLKRIQIPDGVLRIGKGAFRGCRNLKTIDLPRQLYMVEEEAFAGCSALEEVTLPNSLRKIGHSSFQYCCSLSRMILPDGLREIGYYAFQGCRGMESIHIPESITFLGLSAFEDCVSLKDIRLPNLAMIGYGTFQDCSSLTRVEIPEGVEEIDIACFAGCTSLESLTLPSTIKTVGSYAFKDCRNLHEITCLADSVNIMPDAFEGCHRLPEQYRRDQFDGKEEE